MRTPHIRTALVAAGSLAILCGCSNAASWLAAAPSQSVQSSARTTAPVPSIAMASIPRFVAPQAQPVGPAVQGTKFSGKFVYSAQLYGNDLKVYTQSGTGLTYLETLPTQGLSQPQGTVATPNGWWYVTNAGHSNVLIFKSSNSGPVGPKGSLDDYGQYPVNVDTEPSRQLVAVSNGTTVSGGSGSVSVYLNRQSEPSRMLTYGNDTLMGEGVAIDHQGNCYWSFNDTQQPSNPGSIVEFFNCTGNGLLLYSGLGMAGGVAFDQKGDLFYLDQTLGLYKCNKLKNCKLQPAQFGDPVNINFDQKDKDLWVADASGYLDAVDPKTGTISSSTLGEGGPSDPPFGIAPAPGG